MEQAFMGLMKVKDDDIKWYTVDDKYLYIDGTKYAYSCDGSSLRIGNKTYYEK